MVQGGKRIMQMNEIYLTISPESETNCFFHCLAYYQYINDRKYKHCFNNEKIVDRAKDIKKKMSKKFEINQDYTTIEDIQKVCDYYQANITVYDQTFNIMEDVKPKVEKSLEAMSSRLVSAKI